MKCIFTGKDTNSSEHVIPRWLQARFGLAEQDLVVPNGTTLKYKHHWVPADREANNRFGAIDDRISRGILNPPEVYLWAQICVLSDRFALNTGLSYQPVGLLIPAGRLSRAVSVHLIWRTSVDRLEFEADLRREGYRVVNSSVKPNLGCDQPLP